MTLDYKNLTDYLTKGLVRMSDPICAMVVEISLCLHMQRHKQL